MKLNLSKNWIAKLLSLLLAVAIWFLINAYLEKDEAAKNYEIDHMRELLFPKPSTP